MKKVSLIFATVLTLGMVSCKNGNKDMNKDGMNDDSNATMSDDINSDMNSDMDNDMKTVTVNLEAKSGSKVSGTVTFEQKDGKVTMKADVKGLKPGKHAIHIHEKGDCSADDGSSAGGHWNPTDQDHGKWGSSDGYHRGDIGNLNAGDDGKATYERTTDEWCIGCDEDKMNIVGHGIIIHSGADDFTSQPSGAAGKRVACGAIKDNM